MTDQVGSATASGSVAGSGPGATSSGTVSGSTSAVAGTGGGGAPQPGFVSQVPGTATYFPPFHGRTVSWVAVSLVMAAFLIGGLALVFGPTWWLFWASAGLAVVGLLLASATGIFNDWY